VDRPQFYITICMWTIAVSIVHAVLVSMAFVVSTVSVFGLGVTETDYFLGFSEMGNTEFIRFLSSL